MAPLRIPLPRDATQVRLAEAYERRWARCADAALCVTKAMRAELERGWGVRNVEVFYDRPPDFFRPATLEASGTGLLCGMRRGFWRT